MGEDVWGGHLLKNQPGGFLNLPWRSLFSPEVGTGDLTFFGVKFGSKPESPKTSAHTKLIMFDSYPCKYTRFKLVAGMVQRTEVDDCSL